MNTGREIETKRLKLLPGVNKRDSKPFLKMLREDGDFQGYCGAKFSEKNLSKFATYFERAGQEECIYSIFPKDSMEKFIGYVGFHRELNGDYEIEFYIAKNYRRKGYCEEACKAVIKQIFGEGLSVDHNQITVDRLYARLLSTSESASDIQKEELFQITKSDIQMLGEGEKKERESGTARKELDEMVGLASVKTVIHKAIAKHKINKLCMEKGLQRDNASLHMVFTGNPGTAKTTVARLFAEIMKDEKILSTGVFVEAGRADLVGEHVGATAPLVKKKFKEAQGGVLFIDEAYSLCDSYENGFGDEAINTIVQEMENHRDDVIVIFAGYPEPIKAFLDRNPGMRSRIAFSVEFDDYTVEEFCEITKLMLSRKQMTITEAGMKKLKKNFESVKESRDYGNGRFARKMLEEAEMNLAERICQMDETEITTEVLTTIEESDIPEIPMEMKRQIKKIGFAC